MKLSDKNARHFFKIVTPLMVWLHQQKKNYPGYQNGSDIMILPDDTAVLWSLVWGHPELIDKYLAENSSELSDEAAKTLPLWKEFVVSGPFAVERMTDDGTVFISMKSGQVYLVSGITDEIDVCLKQKRIKLPCVLQTHLIPYQGKVIYDGSMAVLSTGLKAELKATLAKRFEEAREKSSLITVLPVPELPDVDEHWVSEFEQIMSSLFPVNDGKNGGNGGNGGEVEISYVDNPEKMNVITPEEQRELDQLFEPLKRSQKQWDRIQDILNDKDVYTADPVDEPGVDRKLLKSVEGLLFYDDMLYVFTSMKKCQEFLIKLSKDEQVRQEKYNIIGISFSAAMNVARRHKMKMTLDFPDDPSERFVTYDSEQNKIFVNIRIL